MNIIEKVCIKINELLMDLSLEENENELQYNRIEVIWDMVLVLSKFKKYNSIDLLLGILDMKSMTVDDVLSFLTACNPIKHKLSNYESFLKKAKARTDTTRGLYDGF